jgi:transcriptional regulator with XRE-family HTH domain
MPKTKIEERRLRAGLSRRELAERCGISESQIYRLEVFDTDVADKNARQPGWSDLVMIAQALGITPAALVGDVTEPVVANEVEPMAGPKPLANAAIHTYRVVKATTLEEIPGLGVGDTIYVDQTEGSVGARKSDDVLLCRVATREAPDQGALMLLKFHAPMLVMTNRPGLNWALRLDDPAFVIAVVGVLMR